LGEGIQQQAQRLRLETLAILVEGHKELLRSLDLGPVDYTLHAEIARTASSMRSMASECGIPDPGKGSPLASPHVASVALAPTAYETHAAMAALLWKERQSLGEPSGSIALHFVSDAPDPRVISPEWKRYLVRITEDGPSLAKLDEAVRPPSSAYAHLITADAKQSAPDLAACALALKSRAVLREARDAIGQ